MRMKGRRCRVKFKRGKDEKERGGRCRVKFKGGKDEKGRREV